MPSGVREVMDMFYVTIGSSRGLCELRRMDATTGLKHKFFKTTVGKNLKSTFGLWATSRINAGYSKM